MFRTKQTFMTVGVTKDFHTKLRQVAASEGKKLFELMDEITLPILEKRLADLNAKAAK